MKMYPIIEYEYCVEGNIAYIYKVGGQQIASSCIDDLFDIESAIIKKIKEMK